MIRIPNNPDELKQYTRIQDERVCASKNIHVHLITTILADMNITMYLHIHIADNTDAPILTQIRKRAREQAWAVRTNDV